jgi:GH24 family phage-related lysozyme (muramidase)
MTQDNQPPQAPQGPSQKTTAVALCIAAACAVAAPIAQRWEGFSPKVYRDPANIATYCYGETENVDPSRIYAKTECAALLRQRMARDYAPKILQCIPQLADPKRKNVFGALIDASYNAGWQGVCKSPMRVNILAGKWTAACNSLPNWYITARYRGKPRPAAAMQKAGWRWNGKAWIKTFQGLVNRRNDERNVCLLAA